MPSPGTTSGRFRNQRRIGHRVPMSALRAHAALKFSILAGREVDTWSEEWRHECEIRFLANLPPGQRNDILDGVKDGPKGVKGHRGEQAVAQLRAEIDRYARLVASGSAAD